MVQESDMSEELSPSTIVHSKTMKMEYLEVQLSYDNEESGSIIQDS